MSSVCATCELHVTSCLHPISKTRYFHLNPFDLQLRQGTLKEPIGPVGLQSGPAANTQREGLLHQSQSVQLMIGGNRCCFISGILFVLRYTATAVVTDPPITARSFVDPDSRNRNTRKDQPAPPGGGCEVKLRCGCSFHTAKPVSELKSTRVTTTRCQKDSQGAEKDCGERHQPLVTLLAVAVSGRNKDFELYLKSEPSFELK